MTEDNINYPKEEARRYRMETSKERAILYREWGYFVLVVLIAGMFIWAMYAFKMTQNVVGAANAKLITISDRFDGIVSKIEDKIDAVDVVGLSKDSRETIMELKGAIFDLRTTERELPMLITDVRQEVVGLSRGVQTLTLEARTQIKQNGDATTRLIIDSNSSVNEKLVPSLVKTVDGITVLEDKFGLTATEAATAIKLASEKTGISIDELNKQISNPRWGQAADNLVAMTGEMNLTVKDLHIDAHNTMKEMPTIAKNIEKTTHNIAAFSKISIIAGIISNLANGLLPGLLR
jgi:hypothetical protein